MKSLTTGGALIVIGMTPLAASAQGVEVGFHGGTTRLDNGYYGSWIQNAEYEYAVCGETKPFVSGFSVNEKGLWNNSVLCSSYNISPFDLHSYVAEPGPNSGVFPPTNNDARGMVNDTTAVANCGERGFVIGVAQPGNDLVAPAGTAVLCGELPTPAYDCTVVQTAARSFDYALDSWETGAPDWTSYPSVTCGPGRFAQAIAFRRYFTAEFDSQVLSFAMGGLVCCSIADRVITGPRQLRWDPPQTP